MNHSVEQYHPQSRCAGRLGLELGLGILPMAFICPEAFLEIKFARTFTLFNYTHPLSTG
jgi:hypothetical protein